MPAQQALTPLLVPQALLARAVAVSSSGVQVAVIGGPALGGLLYTQGASTVYLTCAGLLVLSCALALAVHYRHQPATDSATWRTVLAGVEFVWRHKLLLGATSLDLFAVLLGGATALLPIYARDILHTGPQGLGLLRAAPAVGALAMSLVLARWPLQRHVGHKLLAAVAVFGLATVVFGVSEHFLLSMLALAVTGAADNISVVTRQTLVQLETPDAMRGRVAAVNSIFIGASNQLGEFESGATAALFGPVGSVVMGGVGTVLVATLWLRLFPRWRGATAWCEPRLSRRGGLTRRSVRCANVSLPWGRPGRPCSPRSACVSARVGWSVRSPTRTMGAHRFDGCDVCPEGT
jgi:predicted MFS family arabinose efflux permease